MAINTESKNGTMMALAAFIPASTTTTDAIINSALVEVFDFDSIFDSLFSSSTNLVSKLSDLYGIYQNKKGVL